MASEFDKLVEKLLYDVALSGDGGLSFDKLVVVVKDYYSSRRDASAPVETPSAEDLLFSDEPPAHIVQIDDPFLESIWDWLSAQPDVSVRDYDEVTEAAEATQPTDATIPEGSTLETSPHEQNAASDAQHSSLAARLRGRRLITGLAQVWHAVAGHGIDPSRIKGAEFKLLVLIAKHGINGVVQPDLVKESGQDKRSVPKRTDALTSNGYITKTAVISHGTKTSLLRLTRFQGTADVIPDSTQPRSGGVIYYDKWYDGMMRLFQSNNNVVVLSDLRAELGITIKRWEAKALTRCLRRLVVVGCIRRVKARVAGKSDDDRGALARSIQLMRESTELDRQTFMSADFKKNKETGHDPTRSRLQSELQQTGESSLLVASDDDEDEEDDDSGDDGEEKIIEKGEGNSGMTLLEQRIPPQWTPDWPLQNMIFDMVEQAGLAGLNIMDIQKRAMGPFCRRPMDEMLIRICDAWYTSQPPHLRHLSIVKDTDKQNRSTFFKYRTLAAFKKAVENGDAFWDAIQGNTGKVKPAQAIQESAFTQPSLDRWGFPLLDGKLFAGNGDGSATLEQSLKRFVVESLSYTKADLRPMATSDPQGSSMIKRGRKHVVASTVPQQKDHDAGLPSSGQHKPAKPSKATSIKIPKKRGRPTKAMLAERERLRNELDDGDHQDEPCDQVETPVEAYDQGEPTSPRISTSDMPKPRSRRPKATTTKRPKKNKVVIDTQELTEERSDNAVFEKRADTNVGSTEFATKPSKDLRSNQPTQPEEERSLDIEHPLANQPDADTSAGAEQVSQLAHPDGKSDDAEISIKPSTPSKYGVLINPPGAREAKIRSMKSGRGRPKTCLIAVIWSEHLRREKSLMVEEPHTTPHATPEDNTESVEIPLDTIPTQDPAPNHLEVPVTPTADGPPASPTKNPQAHEHEDRLPGQTPVDPPPEKASDATMPIDTTTLLSKTAKKIGVPRYQGTVQVRRTQTILQIIRKCGGMFPGNRELWYPVAMALLRTTNTTIDKSTVDNSIKDLMARGKLKKLIFQFHSKSGLVVKKAILTEPSIHPGDVRIGELQKKMISAYPQPYLPDEAQIPLDVRQDLDNHINKRITKPYIADVAVGTNRPSVEADDAELFPTDESIVVQRTAAGLTIEEEFRRAVQAKTAALCVERQKRKSGSRAAQQYDSDEDDEEPSPEQLQMMTDFQVQGYGHDSSHAFIKRKVPRSRASNNFYQGRQQHSVKIPRGKLLDREQSVASVDMTLRSIALLTNPTIEHHGPSGTFGTCGVFLSSDVVRSNDDLNSLVPYELPQEVSMDDKFELWDKGVAAQGFSSRRYQRLQPLGSILAARSLPSGAPLTREPHRPMRPGVEVGLTAARGSTLISGSALAPTTILGKRARDAEEETGLSYVTTKKRDRRSAQLFEENERLANAVALYRALGGGMDQRNNWGIIAHMFSFKYDAEFLRRRWDGMKNAREEGVRSLVDRIYQPFLSAYEDGSLPAVDFANMNRTDWSAMLLWLEEQVLAPGEAMEEKLPSLPQSTTGFFDLFSVKENLLLWENPREDWFTSHVEKTRKDLMQEFVYGTPLAGHSRPLVEHFDGKTVLKTWLRAIAVTKAELYDPGRAAGTLRMFADQDVAAACEEMVADKVLRHMNKGRQQPGRNYEIHDATWSLFSRWPGKAKQYEFLRRIATTRQDILEQLQYSESLGLSPNASETEIIVFTNMLDQGLLRITTQLPERKDAFDAPFPKISAFGYSGYSYNAKTLDRSRLRFPIAYEKTQRFTPYHGLVAGVPIPLSLQSGVPSNDARILFWVDIHGNLVPDIWDLVLRSVLHLLVFRPGCTVHTIEHSHSRKLYAWEITLVLDWMEKTGIAMKFGAGIAKDNAWKGGWRASEWWYCAFSPEITTWKTSHS